VLSFPHLPYLPDLVPADFFLFPKMKMQLNGRCFHTAAEIQHKLHKVMDSLTQNEFEPAIQAVASALLCKVTISKEMVFKLK
jgi:hypothetical protein